MKDQKERDYMMQHARTELFLSGMLGSNNSIEASTGKIVLDLVEYLSFMDYTEQSLDKILTTLKSLLHWRTLSPLTGADSEWEDVSEEYGMDLGMIFKNKRYNAVIKRAGKVIDTQAVVYQKPDGTRELNESSMREITKWPYQPNTEIVLVNDTGVMLN